MFNWRDIVLVLGFIITIYLLWRSKSASQSARAASEETRDKLTKTFTIIDLSKIISGIEEIRSLIRDKKWEIVLSKSPSLKQNIVAVINEYGELTDKNREAFQEAILEIGVIEESIERAMHSDDQSVDGVRFNKFLGDVQIKFMEMMEKEKISSK